MMDGEPFIAGMDSLADAVSSFFHLCFIANLEYPKVKIEQGILNFVLHLAVLGFRFCSTFSSIGDPILFYI